MDPSQTDWVSQIDWMFVGGGAALCLFGWLFYWGGLHILGAVALGAAGAGLASLGIQLAEIQQYQSVIVIVSAAIGAGIGVFLIRRLHYLVLGLGGGLLGLAAAMQFTAAAKSAGAEWSGADSFELIAGVIGLLVGALLFVGLHRFVIVMATAAIGSILIGAGLKLENPWVVSTLIFVFALLAQSGALYKWKPHRRHADRVRRQRREE